MSGLRRIQERVTLEGRIDAAGKRVLDVAVLGSESRNGRRYSQRALESAARVLEGHRVYLDHDPKAQFRSVKDWVGRLVGLSVRDGRVRAGELRVENPQHWPLVEAAATVGENGPGLSIDAEARMSKDGKEVLEIVKGHSVDLVASPATTIGLFESEGDGKGSQVQSVIFEKKTWTAEKARAWLKAHDMSAGKVDETGDSFRFRQHDPGGFKRFRTSTNDNAGKGLPAGIKFVFGFREALTREETEMDVTEMTLTDLKKDRADLVTELTEAIKQELAEAAKKNAKAGDGQTNGDGDKALREQVARLQAELDSTKQAALLDKCIHESGVKQISEATRKLLARCADEKEMREVLKDLRAGVPARSSAKGEGDSANEEKSLLEACLTR